MANISFRLPEGWNRFNCQSIDEARVAKRCRDLVGDVTGALETYSDTMITRDNGEADFCPEPNRVISLQVSDRYGEAYSDVDLSYSEDKSKLLRGEVRSKSEGFTAISKVEPNPDGSTTFSRMIEYADNSGVRSEQDISVQMNPDGTLSMICDQGQFPSNCAYSVRTLHAKSVG